MLNQKIGSHTNEQASMANSKGKKKINRFIPEKDLMADITEKNFKTTVLKMLNELKEEKVKKTMSKQNKSINKKTENLKRNEKEILELKSTIIEMKNSLE